MKKVGIVTFNTAYNYGAQLQMLSLYSLMKQYKFDVAVIDYDKKEITNGYKVFRINNKNLLTFFKSVAKSIIFFNKNYIRNKNFKRFITSNIKLIKMKDLHEIEYAICGSDQIWNPLITRGLDTNYTLYSNLFDNKTRISYAASVGNADYIKQFENDFTKQLSKLDYISVRESDAARVLENAINRKVNVVLDPTLLLKSFEWEKYIEHISNEHDEYIFAYNVTFDKEYLNIVNYLSEKTGLKVIYGDMKNPGYKNSYKSIYKYGPLEFVNYIKNAKYIVTTSFHATVFSIIFHKNFVVVPHKLTGGRVSNLLNMLDIQNRDYNTFEEFKNGIGVNAKTDWKSVDDKLEEERLKSINWLKNALDK